MKSHDAQLLSVHMRKPTARVLNVRSAKVGATYSFG